MTLSEKNHNNLINKVKYVEDLEKIPQNLLDKPDYIEKLLHKFGKREDFVPDRILDYAGKSVTENPKFIISTFLKIISLTYTDKYLYENYFETIEYFYLNYVKPLLKNKELSVKLTDSLMKLPILKSKDFPSIIKIDEKNKNLLHYLIKKIEKDTNDNRPAIRKKIYEILEEYNTDVARISEPSPIELPNFYSLIYYLNDELNIERIIFKLIPKNPLNIRKIRYNLLKGYELLKDKMFVKSLLMKPDPQIVFETQDGSIIEIRYLN
jgi:hypothetical protein